MALEPWAIDARWLLVVRGSGRAREELPPASGYVGLLAIVTVDSEACRAASESCQWAWAAGAVFKPGG